MNGKIPSGGEVSDTGKIPQFMILAAARALDEHQFEEFAYGYGRHGWECSCGAKRDHHDPIMEDEDGHWFEALRAVINAHQSEIVLAAAFAECEVTAEWGFAHGGNRPGVDGSLSFAESEAEARMWFTDPSTAGDVRLVRRLVITTPAVVVTPAQEG